MIKVSIKGMDVVLNALEALPDEIADKIHEAVYQAGIAAAGYARTKAPTNKYGEGDSSSESLKNSITAEVQLAGTKVKSEIKCRAPHGQYVEFGTGIPVGHGGPWVYPIIIDGQKTFRVTSGMPPRPFMTPAMEHGKKVLRAKLKRILG